MEFAHIPVLFRETIDSSIYPCLKREFLDGLSCFMSISKIQHFILMH